MSPAPNVVETTRIKGFSPTAGLRNPNRPNRAVSSYRLLGEHGTSVPCFENRKIRNSLFYNDLAKAFLGTKSNNLGV
jgi:hypothetical protein